MAKSFSDEIEFTRLVGKSLIHLVRLFSGSQLVNLAMVTNLPWDRYDAYCVAELADDVMQMDYSEEE